MVIISVLEPVLTCRSEVVPPSHFGKINDVARVKEALLAGGLEIHIDVFFDTVTVARGADHGTGATAQAFATPFRPDRGFELDVQKTGQARYLDLCFEASLDVFLSFDVFLVVTIGGIARFDTL